MFFVDDIITISIATPSVGPIAGGTRITILGDGFRNGITLRCKFTTSKNHTAIVPARYIEDTQIECSSPKQIQGKAMMSVTINGQQYAPSGVSYTYQPAAVLSYISPSSALAEGGTPLTLHGGGFSSASEALGLTLCRIGSALVRLHVASRSTAVCRSPRTAAGFFPVSVRLFAFDITTMAFARHVLPDHASLAPAFVH